MSYELGVKAELFDRRVGVELDLYYLDWKDIVIPQVVIEHQRPGHRHANRRERERR